MSDLRAQINGVNSGQTPVFKKGDVVRLKSTQEQDGPWMTIERVEDNSVLCVWFDEKKR